MSQFVFPVINVQAFGRRFQKLRTDRSISIKQIQNYLGLGAPQAIYKWQSGKGIPSTDHLLALSFLFDVPMEELLGFKRHHPQDPNIQDGNEIYYFSA